MLTRVTIPDLHQILRITLATDRQPILLLGAPGVAKTQFCRDVVPGIYASVLGCDVSEVGYIEFSAGQRDPVEVSGIGLPKKGADGRWETEFSKSPLLCMIEATGKSHGVLNIDELTQANPEMQKVIRPLLDSDTRTTGGDKIPEGWVIIATGNRLADKSGSTRLLSHVANACLRFEMVFDFQAWRDWAASKAIHPLLIACVEATHEAGLFVDAVPAEDVQFCTPRSFSRAAVNLTHLIEQQGPQVAATILARRIVEGTCGTGAADTIIDYLSFWDKIPSGADIQRDPAAAVLPDETHLQYAASNIALSTATDSQSADNALAYIVRLRPDLQISAGCALIRKSTRGGWPVVGPVANQFTAKYHDLLPLTV